MTLTADTDADAGENAVAARVRKIRAAQETGVSRAEGWRGFAHLLGWAVTGVVIVLALMALFLV